jgi:hypothetical protein
MTYVARFAKLLPEMIRLNGIKDELERPMEVRLRLMALLTTVLRDAPDDARLPDNRLHCSVRLLLLVLLSCTEPKTVTLLLGFTLLVELIDREIAGGLPATTCIVTEAAALRESFVTVKVKM